MRERDRKQSAYFENVVITSMISSFLNVCMEFGVVPSGGISMQLNFPIQSALAFRSC